jgi:signal peptidase I
MTRLGSAAQHSVVQVQQLVWGKLRLPAVERGMLLRLLVPGLAQRACGQPGRGRAFFFPYLLLLGLGILAMGSTWGSVCLGLAFSVHASSALDFLLQCRLGFVHRMVTSLAAMAGLALGVYGPIAWLVTRVADPLRLELTLRPFRQGDVVLYNHWAYQWSRPKAGDVVLYELEGRYMASDARQIAQQGQRIDRVLAGPGDEIVWEDGRLRVNGAPDSQQPLNPAAGPAQLRLTVPIGHYFILPTTTPYTELITKPEVWRELSLVPLSRIQGTVYWRHSPVSRMGSIP